MQFSNTKEDGLETIIVDWLVKHNGYEQGTNADYNKEYAIDETRLFRFLADTQPDEIEKLAVFKSEQKKRTFLNRLQGELAKRGIIDVLRNGIKVYPADLIMFYLTPNENNDTAKALYAKNIFSVTRQLRYSIDAGKLALDLCIFINGLPVITFELKNQLTKQNVENAVQQYKDDRSPKEQIFSFKRCMVHFAVDDDRVKFCTKLAAQDSWFLPFDKGYNDGAGNPPNPNGLKTDYLWKEILTKDKLTRIIESYAQVVTEVDEETKKKTVKQIFPRYHQLDVVEKLIADVEANGVGNRYLIQHSAGSGKSNSIAWLAYRLMELEKDAHPIFNSILVVTDRRILDKQIRDNIKQFAQVGNVVAWAEHSGDLRKAITDGKRIIITTIEKFPYVVPDIGAEHKDNKFAILIDEAHSGQNGRNSAQMNLALSGLASDNDMDNEDKINAMMEGRKLLKNASYFAFTATPKNKTLETFGKKLTDEKGNPIYNEDGTQKALAFHVYTMKQAIQEGFILDVLKNYTPIDSFYKLSQSTRLHKMLVQYKKDIADYKSKLKEAQSRPYYNPRHNKPENEPAFFKEMSDECMSRAIAILDTVFKSIESLGGSINSDLSVKIRDDIVRFRMVESQDQVKHEMTKQEAQELVKYNDDIKNHRWASKPQIRKYDKVYNGKLRIEFGERSYIRDKDSEKLEDRLGDILVTLYEKAEENRIVREAREEAERKRVEEARCREENRQRKEQEIRLVKELVNKAEDYRIAKEIREYIQAMIDSGNEDITPEWIEWALKKADWYDPSIETEDEYLGKRQHEKSAEEKEKSLQDSIRKSWYW